MMEHKPTGGESEAKKDTYIPFYKPATLDEKIATQRRLEDEIKTDEEIEKSLKVAREGLNAPTAQKMLKDTISTPKTTYCQIN